MLFTWPCPSWRSGGTVAGSKAGSSTKPTTVPQYGWPVLRYALDRRWIVWHVLCLAIVIAFAWLGVWQLRVSWAVDVPGGPEKFHLRNFAYGLQWFVFIGFVAWFWYRFMRDQRNADAQAALQADPAVSEAGEPVPGDLNASAGDWTAGPGSDPILKAMGTAAGGPALGPRRSADGALAPRGAVAESGADAAR